MVEPGNRERPRLVLIQPFFARWINRDRLEKIIDITSKISFVLIGFLIINGGKIFEAYFHPTEKTETLDDRIRKLTGSLNEAARNISDIEGEIEQRKSLAARLKSDADEAQKLATLNAQQVAAVAQALRGQLKEESRDSYWSNIATNAFWAIFGALSGEAIRIFRSFIAKRKKPD